MANYIILLILLENYLTSLLRDQANLFCGVKGQVSSLQNDLKIIVDLLTKNNVEKQHYGDDVKKVVDQVQDVCIEVEDVIDMYLAQVLIQRKQKMGNPLGRLSHLISHVKVLCNAVNKTRSIAKDFRKHINDNNEEAANGTGGAESSAAAAHLHQSLQRRRDFVEEDYVVGFDRDTTSLVSQLTDLENLQRSVISIIGMGGLGKTTLARKIYNNICKDPHINSHFDCVAWVYVSQEYSRKRFFLELLECFDLNYHNLSDEDLVPTVRDHLRGKRYFVVMDEIWQTQVWQEVGEAFLDDSNGSRILITSRHREIASHASPDTLPFMLSFLNNDASWELFCTNKKLIFLKENNCSPKLKNLGKKFVEGCEGLPLSIIELGEILANEGKSYQTWSNYFFDDINGYSKRTSKWCLDYVALSYNHLPHHLKPCFLYVGVFPKDYEIQKRVLIQLWIAEGFIQQSENKTADSVAEDYLKELIDRSLIQVTSRRSDESVKTCRIHSLIRDYCTMESLREKFLEVQLEDDLALYSKGLKVQPENDFASRRRGPLRSTEGNLELIRTADHGNLSSSCVNPRRFSVHCKSLSYYITWNTRDTTSARSLLYFCGQNQIDFDKRKWVRLHQGLNFVRVLSFFNINIKSRLDLSGIENLIFLRCFKISGTSIIEKLPDSMCNLRFLETLDLGVQVPDRLWPKNLWRMKQLRRLYSLPMMFPLDDQKEMGKYSCNLQVLSDLYVDKKTTDFLANSKFPNLLDLGLFYKWSERLDQSEMTKVLESLQNLQHLQRLSISGFTKCDNRSYILASTVTKVRLNNSYVDSNLFSILGNLPNLRALTIKLTEMDCESDLIKMEAGKFPQLQVFKIIGYDIQKWELEREAMPKLQHLVILGNQRMEALPDELWNREDLRLVQMSDISESLRNWLLKLTNLMEKRDLESPPAAGNPRYLQGKVLELNMENGCKVLIGKDFS